MKAFKTQMDKTHYNEHYDNFNRFIDYFYQIELIRKTKPKTILEVGIGHATLSNYLKSKGLNIITCDFDESLKPDIVADIRNLPFEENQFDTVVAFEILEHLPFKDFKNCLNQLHKVTKRHLIISLPYSGIYIEFILKFPLIMKLFKKPIFNILLSIPLFTHRFSSKQHYWEVGRKGYSRNRIKNLLKQKFIIKKDFRPPINSHHWFLVLEKK
jgi:ubiquinone/menaquinone biosynthesis C-methylase UbiE